MDTFWSNCPVVKRTMEKFSQSLVVGGERIAVPFEREVFWLQSTESHVRFEHGGKVVRDGATYTDYYGYMTSVAEAEDGGDVRALARTYGVNQESTLELLLETKVRLVPVLAPAPRGDRSAMSGGQRLEWCTVPNDWRHESLQDGERRLAALGVVELGSCVVWSSRRSEQDNAEVLKAFRDQWKATALATDLVSAA